MCDSFTMCMFANICVSFLRRDLRFIEVVENVCQRLLEYNLHKERSGSNRFAKVSPLVCLGVCECGCVRVLAQLYVILIHLFNVHKGFVLFQECFF